MNRTVFEHIEALVIRIISRTLGIKFKEKKTTTTTKKSRRV